MAPADRSTAGGDATRPTPAQLFERYAARVYAAALAVTFDHAEAEDAAQETFVKALERWDGDGSPASGAFEGRSDPGTWLFRIAINTARDHIRRRGAERARARRAADRGTPTTRPSSSLAVDPARLAEERDELCALERALRRLGPDQREAFGLREIAGLSVREVAATLGCSEAKVRVDLHRARRRLREILGRSES